MRVRQALEAFSNYGNLGRMLAQRVWPGRFPSFEVSDRRSGVTCEARPGAERLFGEIWFDHDYDIPCVHIRKDDVVLDIGGNQGFYACYAAQQGARVYSFEPDAQNLALLRRNVERNGFAHRVTVHGCAVKGHTGTTSFFTTPTLGGGMQTTMDNFAEFFGHDRVGDVPCTTLTDHAAAEGIGAIRICKIDCEGAELEIVQTITPEFAARIDGLVIEFHAEAYNPLDLVTALEKLGTHHLLLAPAKSFCERNVIWGVSHQRVREQAARWAHRAPGPVSSRPARA